MTVLQVNQLLQNKIVEKEARHFKVVDGQAALLEQLDNVGWPFESPDNRPKNFAARQPDAPSSKFAGVAVSNVGWHPWNELAAECGPFAHDQKHGSEVSEGMLLLAVWVDLGGRLVGIFGAVEGAVEGGEEGGAARDSEASVLAFADQRLKLFDFAVPFSERGGDGLPD